MADGRLMRKELFPDLGRSASILTSPVTLYLYVVGLVFTELVHRLVVTFHLEKEESKGTSSVQSVPSFGCFPGNLPGTLDMWPVT